MYYRAKEYTKKVKQRILRHKRTRYHNDAYLSPDDTKSYDRKKRASSKKQINQKKLEKNSRNQ